MYVWHNGNLSADNSSADNSSADNSSADKSPNTNLSADKSPTDNLSADQLVRRQLAPYGNSSALQLAPRGEQIEFWS
jgi:hypothetical protein